MSKSNQISKKDAVRELWHRGSVNWKLHPVQKKMLNSYITLNQEITVIASSRRLGKSFFLVLLAIETCLKTPNAIVKYVCPKKNMVKTIIQPIMTEILKDCPPELKPEFKYNDYLYLFPNGSQIQMAGTDNGHHENLRGGASHLWIVDEAGFCDELNYVVNTILAPTSDTTGGRGIIASTPSKQADHDFIVEFLKPAEYRNELIKYTIYDNPLITQAKLQTIINRYKLKEQDPEFRREYLCVDENTPVKTKDGYKLIKNIEVGDLVYTHKGRYRKVLNKWLNPLGDRKVYEVKSSNNLGHILTENHLIYVSEKHINSDKFSEGDWVPVQSLLNKKKYTNYYFKVPIDNNILENNINADLAYLSGWYCAEGHCSKHTQQVILSLNHKDPIDKIQQAALRVFGKSFQPYTKAKSCTQWVLNSKIAKNYFKQFGRVAKDKKLPSFLKYANSDIKKVFLDAYLLGDGHRKKGIKVLTCNSISLQLICDLSDMFLSLGVGCSIQKLHNEHDGIILNRKVHISDSWILYISGKNLQIYDKLKIDKRSRSYVRNGYFYSRINKITEISYNKPIVYDIEVEQDHSYVGLHAVFHNCEVINNPDTAVVPEFTDELEIEIVKEWPKPPFYDAYVSMDIGGKDMTVVLFAYYDFKNGLVIVEDELAIPGKETRLDRLAKEIKSKEEKLYTNSLSGEFKAPYLRVSDNNNLILLNDLAEKYGKVFVPTRKDNKDAALNEMRIKLSEKRIIINPRCKTLIYHLKNATWAKNKKDYLRGADGSHYDGCDAMTYLIRNIQFHKNPYPPGYGIAKASEYFNIKLDQLKPEHQKWVNMFKSKKSLNRKPS